MRLGRPSPGQDASAALGFMGAACWACLIASGFYADGAGRTLIAVGAIALGPIMMILFAALAVREARGARRFAERIAGLTETASFAPSRELVAETHELTQSLRAEMEALDAVVLTTAKRLNAFEQGLRADGGVLARALVDDLKTMGHVRQELNSEAMAVGEAIGRHVSVLRETSEQVREEAAAAHAAVGAQVEAFGAVSATLGARSAEFAAAADLTTGSASRLDAAVEKALKALAHATSITNTARKSAEEAAFVAQEAAGAVRGATRTAIAEARDATKRLRSNSGMGRPVLPRLFGGLTKTDNLAPPALKTEAPRGEVIELLRPAKAKLAKDAPFASRPISLADIAEASGVDLLEALGSDDLDLIARAARDGADARRDAVRRAAVIPVRKISIFLRRDAGARRDAEALRREPGRALGAPTDDAGLRRKLASAYLLIDTVLG